MQIELKENVIYQTFKTKRELQEMILSMILNSKTDKILYKGNPRDINYKLMKKVVLKDYTQRIDPELIKEQYQNVVESCKQQNFCVIYKVK
jgi:hypothetical protein